jgi:hypothetical protein
MKFYRGKFRPANPGKYEGDFKNIVYRSMWERQVFLWCDRETSVVGWSSEEVIIPYRCATDNKMHRYFMDLKIKFKNGDVYLIEIKPKSQTQEPKKRSRTTQKYINEVMTYAKNQSKWNAAASLCEQRGWHFEVWTEDTLKKLGIKLLT